MSLQTILFMGVQGSGKGTQAALLQDYFEKKGEPVFHFETGDGFRELKESGTFTGKRINETLNRGEIQPDFLTVYLWGKAFFENLTGEEHLILDGFPRTKAQADMLESTLAFYKRENPTILLLALDEEKARERLKGRGRHDDNDEGIAQRFAWYREYVLPIVEHYRAKDGFRVLEINGDQTIEAVHADIKESLGLQN